jgi:hypothetical protein
MWAITRATLLIICLSHLAGAQTNSLALYASEASRLDASALRAAQQELDRLLIPTGIELSWRTLKSRTTDEQFDRVVVMSFDGSCSTAAPAASLRNLPSSDIKLADSSVSNGEVLPFFHLDCAHLARLLTPALAPLSTNERNVAFGRALGRVMAHEIYHIVGETTAHQSTGVAKASLSVRDLIGDSLNFDVATLTLMRPPVPQASPEPAVSVVRSYPRRDVEIPGTEKIREP